SSARMAGFSAPVAPTRKSFMDILLVNLAEAREWAGAGSRGRGTANPFGGRRLGTDDALLEHDVAVEPALAGLDDGVAGLDAFVEGDALGQGRLRVRVVPADQPVEVGMRLLALLRLADHFHADRSSIDEAVERHQGQHRVDHIGGGVAIEADDIRAGALGGIVGIDNGNLVAMAHGAEGEQQVRADQRWDSLEHVWFLLLAPYPKGKDA